MGRSRVITCEMQRLRKALRSLDVQTTVVLTVSALLLIVTFTFGSRFFFIEHVAPNGSPLQAWGWWFLIQGITGFVIPLVILVIGFGHSLSKVGVGLGDWKLGLTVVILYVPVVIIGTWIFSDDRAFQLQYPHFRAAVDSWPVFMMYHGLFLIYWVGWEYLWRGFLLFGTYHSFGIHAIFVSSLPYALLHVDKPTSELLLSLVGGIVLGAVVWRCRSFWVAVPIHAVQMMALDFWCSLRLRSGVSGIGFDALRTAFFGI